MITNIQENYADETKAVKELISAQKRIIFMTSAYHIYRTKKLFAKWKFNVIPFKVDFKKRRNKKIKIMVFIPSVDSLKEKGMELVVNRKSILFIKIRKGY